MKHYLPRRYEGPSYDERHVQRPIFGIDIDGTLGFYHEHFWAFACAWTGKDLPHPRDYRGGSFAAFLGLAKSTYRKIKLAYRRGGAKRSMPVVDGAYDLTRTLRSRGAVVVLCTTRPYLSLEGIDEDTRHWASRNKIQHDFIIWGENKYRDLSRFGERVVSVLEDEPALMKQAMSNGLLTNKIERSYNKNVPFELNGYHCDNLSGASIALHDQLDEWEKEAPMITIQTHGGLPPDSEGFETQHRLALLFEKCLQLQEKKAQTYGEAYRSQGYMGNIGRVLSKASRLKKMVWCDLGMQRESVEESVMDTLLDLINIAAFAIINYTDRNKWGNDV